jgi:hypothetical protein
MELTKWSTEREHKSAGIALRRGDSPRRSCIRWVVGAFTPRPDAGASSGDLDAGVGHVPANRELSGLLLSVAETHIPAVPGMNAAPPADAPGIRRAMSCTFHTWALSDSNQRRSMRIR